MRLNECAEPQAPAQQGKNSPTSGDPITDRDRYSRQVLFAGIGEAGQQRLAAAHVAIVGCGAMGAASASLLARAGIGTLTLIDRDFVEPSNLQRQVLFDEADALQSLPKAAAARRHIGQFNSSVTVHAHIADLIPGNIAELLAGSAANAIPPVDIILDATDNFETRYLINDYAVEQGKPWIYAAAIGAYAATMNVLPVSLSSRTLTESKGEGSASSLNCGNPPRASPASSPSRPPATWRPATQPASSPPPSIWPRPSRSPRRLSSSPASRSSCAAACSRSTCGTRWATPAWNAPRSRPALRGQAARSAASASSRISPGKNRAHITLCGRDSVQIHEHHRPVDFAAMRARLATHADITDLRSNDLLLRFRRGPHTLTLFADGRAIVQGTTDVTVARSLYARFVGS